MSEWRTLRLGDVVRIKHGYAFDGKYFSNDPHGPRVVTPGNFAIGGGWKYGKTKYYQGPEPDGYRLNQGDLILTMTDLSRTGDTLGYPALVPDGGRFLHNQRIGLVEIQEANQIHKRFLYYMMCSPPYREHILATATGSTVRHTSPNRISAYEASVPSVPAQEAIAEMLGVLDDKIGANRGVVNVAEQLLRSRFQRLLRLSQDQDEVSVGDLLVNRRDVCSPATVSPQMPYVGLEHMPLGSVVIPKCGIAADVTSGKCRFGSGDILFGRLRPYFRKVALAFTEGICSSDILVLQARHAELLPFALCMASSQEFIDYCDGVSSGTRMPRVSWKDMTRYRLRMPTSGELRNFNGVAIPALAVMNATLAESQRLTQLRDTLLPPLLSGELSVQDSEVLVEGAG